MWTTFLAALCACAAGMAAARGDAVVHFGSLAVDTQEDGGTMQGLSAEELRAMAREDSTHARLFVIRVSDIAKVNGQALEDRLGVKNAQFVPPSAFQVPGTYETAAAAREMEGVEWVSEVRPEWKRRTFFSPPGAQQEGQVRMRVTFVPAPAGALSEDQLRALYEETTKACAARGAEGGELVQLSRGFATISVPGKHAAAWMDCLADLPHVQHAEVHGRMKLHQMRAGGAGATRPGIIPHLAVAV